MKKIVVVAIIIIKIYKSLRILMEKCQKIIIKIIIVTV